MTDSFADLLGADAAEKLFAVSVFNDPFASTVSVQNLTIDELADFVRKPIAPSKTRLPLVKLATFGTLKTDKGALRHDDNVTALSGVIADYDAGQISIGEAAERLANANVAAIIVTTSSHRPNAPRWRVIAPFAETASPNDHERHCARLNGALGGILAPESFNLSQAYYYGHVEGAPEPETRLVKGQRLDTAADLDAGAIGRDGQPFVPRARQPDTRPAAPDDFDAARVAAILGAIPVAAADADDGRDLWLRIGMGVHHASGGSDEGFALWDAWSSAGEKYDAKDQERTWKSLARKRRGEPVTLGSLIEIAKGYGFDASRPDIDLDAALAALDDLDPIDIEPSRKSGLRFVTPTDCAVGQSRGYVVKGLMAPADVGCIYGAPGAGKSLISPHIGYMVALGRKAFGMRTKPGRVLYIAPEDPHGMKDRVRALRNRHGDAPEFLIGEGLTDLLASDSADRRELLRQVEVHQPRLIFIDTLAMAFPGLEENSAEAMGRVVAVARSLTVASNAAVVLVHHDTKQQSPTPRGHSLLNGALDFALQLFPRDETGIVRGRLSKNRNGPCDRDIAFRIDVEELGTDEDGDAITAAVVFELPPGEAPKRVKMSPSSVAARRLLNLLQTDEHGSACEAEWRASCIDGRSVSASDDRDSRRKATDRAIRDLVQKGIVTVRDGRVLADNSALSGFDDLEP